MKGERVSEPTIVSAPTAASWRRAWWITGAITALWAVVLPARGILQYLRYHMHAFDLGIFAQGTWLLSQFKDPFVTIRGLHLFADHSSYILLLIVPIYAVFPDPVTLIVLTGIAMAACAPLAFVVARRFGAGPLWASITAVLVLVSPAVQWQLRDTFHPEVFVVPLVIAAIALLQRDRDIWAIAAILLALTAKEDVALLVAPLGIAIWLLMGKRRTGLIVVFAGIGAFLLNFLVLLPAWSPTGELLYSYRYGHLGDSPVEILIGLATKPGVWWDTFTGGKQLGYIASLTLAMPMCFLGWRWLLVGLPALFANVFSLHGYQYGVQWHYTAYLIVVVVIAAAAGAGRIEERWVGRKRTGALVVSILVPVILWVMAAPITVWAPAHEHPARISAMLSKIPADASVSAWTTFVPHLADREQIYLFPNPWQNHNYGAEGVEPPPPESIEYVAIRMDSYREYDELIDELSGSPDYEVIHEDHPFYLIRRIAPLAQP